MGKNMEKAVASTEAITNKNLRYERKFIFQGIEPQDLIETVVLSNSFCFREIFHRRTVNNIYYDDPSMSFYHQNVSGDELRDKYRLRWYGDAFEEIKNPVLEIKKKYGTVGDKLSFPLNVFDCNLKTSSLENTQQKIANAIKKQHPPILLSKLNSLSPSLYNSYERRYFLSDCEQYRITIDYNMAFYNPNFKNYEASKTTMSDLVLELKYKVKHDTGSRRLTQQFTSRLSKNSKYVRGIDAINHHQHT